MTRNMMMMLKTISSLLSMQRKGEYFGWNSIASNIDPENTNVFNTPGKLKVEAYKLHCDPKWINGSTEENLQFFMKSNMM